ELAFARLGQNVAENVGQGFLLEGDGETKGGILLGHADVGCKMRPFAAIETVEIVKSKSPGDFPCPVGAEVEEDEAVPVLHSAYRRIAVADDTRNYEFVVHTGGIALFYRFGG